MFTDRSIIRQVNWKGICLMISKGRKGDRERGKVEEHKRMHIELRATEKVHICFVQCWSFITETMAAIKALPVFLLLLLSFLFCLYTECEREREWFESPGYRTTATVENNKYTQNEIDDFFLLFLFVAHRMVVVSVSLSRKRVELQGFSSNLSD